MKLFRRPAIILLIIGLASCGMPGDSQVYTLYRNSTVDGINRVHVATFDAADGEQYNHENCQLAAELFQQQPGTQTKFWCEKGQFRK